MISEEIPSSPVTKVSSPSMKTPPIRENLSVPSFTIDMSASPAPSRISGRSSKGRRRAGTFSKDDPEEKKRREKKKEMEMTVGDMSYRLSRRKFLHGRLTIVSDIMCFLGILGIILMIITNELNFTRYNDVGHLSNWIIKLFITITTCILLVLVLVYHRLDLEIYSIQNSLNDWRVGLTGSRIIHIFIEIAVCAVHPMPRRLPSGDDPVVNSPGPFPLSHTALDVGLGIPMFLRLYLLGRIVLLHSHLVRDASLQSLGFLNRVSINFFFLMKTFLEQSPSRSLSVFCTLIFLIGSWSLRATNYQSDGTHFRMSDSMWLFIITFTTVGYGDIYPSTTAGRCIAAMIGIVGILSSALLINVVAQKLTFRREEKYVHTFVLNIELAKSRRSFAANVIKFAILTWFLKHKNRRKSIQYLQARRNLFSAIRQLKQTKQQQGSLIDNCVGLRELMTSQRSNGDQIDGTALQITEMRVEINKIDEQMVQVTRTLDSLQTTLNSLLEKMSQS